MTVDYTLYVRVNPYGKDMFYQLSLYVWEENIGLSCIVLDFVKNLNIQASRSFFIFKSLTRAVQVES